MPTFLHIRGDERDPDKSRAIEPGLPAFLSLGEIKIEPVPLPAEAYQPGLRPFVLESHLKTAEQRIADARAALEAAKSRGGPSDDKPVEPPPPVEAGKAPRR